MAPNLKVVSLPSLALIALAASSVGCTITSYKDPEPQAQAARPAGREPGKPEPSRPARRPGFRPSGALATGGAGGGNAPRVTSPTVFGSGQTGPFRGHAYVVPETTTKMPDVGQLVPFASFYTDSFNVQSQPFTSGFPGALAGQVEYFAIRYDGRFSVPNDATYEFKVVSDDGSILYVDGAKVLDNDGVHTSAPASGRATLKAGFHALRLDYFQAKGPVALQVFLVENGRERLLTGGK